MDGQEEGLLLEDQLSHPLSVPQLPPESGANEIRTPYLCGDW